MVHITKGPHSSGSRITDPANTALRSAFNHLALQWPGKESKSVVQRQVETIPGESGVLLQDL